MNDYYELQLSLKIGSYQYKFIVDGEWVHDEDQPKIMNSFKTYNNVKEVLLDLVR